MLPQPDQNDGGFIVSDGYNFTTAGDFTNNGGISVSTGNGASTVMTISGSLTNYDAGTHTLAGGTYAVEDTSDPSGVAKLRFPMPIFARSPLPALNWLVQAHQSPT